MSKVKHLQSSAPHVLRAYRGPTERELVSCSVEKEGSHGTSQEHDVQPYRPVALVASVQLDSLAEKNVVTPGNLPRTSDARRNAQYLVLGKPDLLRLARKVRSGADQAHPAAQDVPDLRQLVEARLAQEVSDACNAGIVAQL